MATNACASLYVGDLHVDVTEAILYEKFQVYGNVLSVRVCRDLETRKSMGYAYINYQTKAEAKHAMDNLNYECIHDRPCRILWSQRDPATRRSGVGSIFIRNLDPSVTVKEIYDTFAVFGEVTSCKVQYDEYGASKGLAFVNLGCEKEAEEAIKATNGKWIRDKIVYVSKFVPRNQRSTVNKDFTNCFVKNLPNDADEAELREIFGPYGDVASAKVMVDGDGVSKGFGFVSFMLHDQAVRAVNALNGTVLRGQEIYVGRAITKNERQRELNAKYKTPPQERLQEHTFGIFVRNLSNDITDDRLRQEFAVFGNITAAKVMIDSVTNVSKGFAFVSFSSPDAATRARSEMNGKIVDGRPLYVAVTPKKEDRIAQLRLQLLQRFLF